MNNTLFVFAALILAATLSANATPPNLSQKYLRLKTNFTYLNTTANFDNEGGSFEDLPSGQFYRNYRFSGSALYTFRSDIAFEVGAGFAHAQSRNSVEERTNTQLTDVQGKIYYQLLSQPFELIPYIGGLIPFNRVDTATDEVLTGEGALEAFAGTWFVKEFNSNYLFVNLAYHHRDEGRADLLPWLLGLELDFDGFYAGADVSGLESLTDDEFTQNPQERANVTTRVNGGSFAFYSVNPQKILVGGWAAFDLTDELYLALGYRQTLDGKNTALEQIAYANLEIRVDMTKNRRKKESIIDRKEKKRLKRFQIEAEDYDEKLFDPDYHRKRRQERLKEKQMLKETEDLLDN